LEGASSGVTREEVKSILECLPKVLANARLERASAGLVLPTEVALKRLDLEKIFELLAVFDRLFAK
jgi:hypothetical protein